METRCSYRKTRYLGLSLIALGVLMFLAFAASNSYVDEQGILHEPFALVPLGYLFILVGTLLALLSWLLVWWRGRR